MGGTVMSRDFMDYNGMVENALRSVVRQALERASEIGLPGNHHFYITFRTDFPGVDIPDYLKERHADEMTIVLQHQFWGLDSDAEKFGVTLSFNRLQQRLIIPYAAVTGFADPSVQFGLQFRVPGSDGAVAIPDTSGGAAGDGKKAVAEAPAETAEPQEKKTGEVVALDAFRKK